MGKGRSVWDDTFRNKNDEEQLIILSILDHVRKNKNSANVSSAVNAASDQLYGHRINSYPDRIYSQLEFLIENDYVRDSGHYDYDGKPIPPDPNNLSGMKINYEVFSMLTLYITVKGKLVLDEMDEQTVKEKQREHRPRRSNDVSSYFRLAFYVSVFAISLILGGIYISVIVLGLALNERPVNELVHFKTVPLSFSGGLGAVLIIIGVLGLIGVLPLHLG